MTKNKTQRYQLYLIVLVILTLFLRVLHIYHRDNLARNISLDFVIDSVSDTCWYQTSRFYFSLPDCGQFEVGSVLHLTGTLDMPDSTPAAVFDSYLLIKKRLKLESFYAFSPDLNSVKGWIYQTYSNSIKARVWLFELLQTSLEEPYLSLVWQLTFGKVPTGRSFADPIIAAIGMQHISSVSGLHFGIIFGVIDAQFSHSRSKTSIFLLIGLLFIYCLVAGWRIPALRAFIMIVFYLFSAWYRRQYHSKTALFLTTWILLLANPYLVTSVSLHLSFAGTAGVLFFYPIFSSKMREKGSLLAALGSGHGAVFVESFLVSTAAQLAVFPLLLQYFQEFHPLSSISGIVLFLFVPIIIVMSLVTTTGLIIAWLLSASNWVYFAIGQPISVVSNVFLWLADSLSILEKTAIQSAKNDIIYSILYYLFLVISIFIYHTRARQKRKFQSVLD